MSKHFVRWFCAVSLAVLGGFQAHAVPIIYVISGIAEGNVDGDAFQSNIMLVLEADTDDISNFPEGKGVITRGPTLSFATPAIAGLITVPIGVAVDQTESTLFAFTASDSEPIIILENPAFASYGLDTALGPVLGGRPEIVGFEDVPTEFGLVTVTEMDPDTTFQAAFKPGSMDPVTAPGVLGIFAIGLGAVGVLLHRRRRTEAVTVQARPSTVCGSRT